VRRPKYNKRALDELFWRASGCHCRGVVRSADINSTFWSSSSFLITTTSFGDLPKIEKTQFHGSLPAVLKNLYRRCHASAFLKSTCMNGLCLFPPFFRTQNLLQVPAMTSLPVKTYQKCFARQRWRQETRRYRCDERGVCEDLHTRN